MSTKEYLVTLNVPLMLEELITDCLLTFESEQGFSSLEINAHDHRHRNLSLAEQVSGRQKKIRFQMYIDQQDLSLLLDKLKTEFSESGIQYWILPVIDTGYL